MRKNVGDRYLGRAINKLRKIEDSGCEARARLERVFWGSPLTELGDIHLLQLRGVGLHVMHWAGFQG